MELGNVVLLPAFMVWMAHYLEYQLGWLTWVSLVPMCGLLMIGGLYWRAKLRHVQGHRRSMERLLPWVHRMQWPFAVSSILVLALCLTSWVGDNLALSFGDKITASIAATLAVLEYVNYYHRQLQHFDHVADWKRLLGGKGFRESQMATDLRRFRQKHL